MLDHKGKTGSIDVIFNGIDSNNLRLSSFFNRDAIQKNTANATNSNTNNDAAASSCSNNQAEIACSTQTVNANELSRPEGAVGGELASVPPPVTVTGVQPTTSYNEINNLNNSASTSNFNTIQDLSLGLPQG